MRTLGISIETVKMLQDEIGQVTGIDEKDPARLFVQFDNDNICDCLAKSLSLPSAWMEPFQPANPFFEEKRRKLAAELISFFFEAVEGGDLRNVKLLHGRHGVDAEARNSVGKTALHLASHKGYKELTDWLLDKAQVDVEQPDLLGYRAIHYAVLGCKTEVLKSLLESDAEVDSKNYGSKQTALHMAVFHQFVECLAPLMKFNADINLQNAEGNTPLHVAVEKGNGLILHKLLSMYSSTINWDLRNKKGLNVFHQAVIKDDFTTVKLILDDKNFSNQLLNCMPDDQSNTVLHYACTNKNFKMAKLLVDESNWILADELPFLHQLLEARNLKGETALLIACGNKDFAMVELLVKSGADVKAVDYDGNTAILLAGSSPAPDKIPLEEDSPAIFKFYQRALLGDNADSKAMMQSHPILSFIAYLIDKGSLLESVNNSGKSGSDVIASQGSRVIIYKLLVQLLKKQSGCMGKKDCKKQPALRLYCPHKEDFEGCLSCFLPNFEKIKCGCSEENAISIDASLLNLLHLLSSNEGTHGAANGQDDRISGYDFKLIQDGSKNGYLEDQMNNKYEHSATRRIESVIYLCKRETVSAGKCRAVARRYKKDGIWVTRLDEPHNHPVSLKRKPAEEGNSSQPPAKKP